MRWHPGGRVHSVSRDPGATQTKWLHWDAATPFPPSPALAIGKTPAPQLDTVNPSIPQRPQRGCSPGRGLRIGAVAPPRHRPRCPSPS